MILVQDHRDVWMGFDRGQHHVAQIWLSGVLSGAGRGLQNHGAAGLLRRLHNGLDLFEVVYVECRDAIVMFCGVIE